MVYERLYDCRREALSTVDAALRREKLAAADSLGALLAGRCGEIESAWRRAAVEYYDRGDGSFTEFCRAAGIDSGCAVGTSRKKACYEKDISIGSSRRNGVVSGLRL